MKPIGTSTWINIAPGQTLAIIKNTLILTLTVWASVMTVFAFRNESHTTLLLLDDSGLRPIVLDQFADEQEQLSLIKEFIRSAYALSKTSADQNKGKVSTLVTGDLLKRKTADLSEVFDKARDSLLVQTPRIVDLRTLGGNQWEADVALKIQTPQLPDKAFTLRVKFTLEKQRRTLNNWRAWQIGDLDEQQI